MTDSNFPAKRTCGMYMYVVMSVLSCFGNCKKNGEEGKNDKRTT